ncbi:DUF4336 domain-containing protein [Romeria aff. gracilis LEGE 07310]|uniref:DUF4336 domain-containing protein n=1 Tax=Vasconcelosia minhoensis LEGE 07310 TaxID=915328 RepID=A0A8J7DD23_9CYAN|nr:DUF4336 domain-containing protein [Romeria aff. gracilis LEGE 07310]
MQDRTPQTGDALQEKQPRGVAKARSREFSWNFWPAAPLYPYGQRRTLQREIVKDRIWTFDQTQGILYVIVPVRMTVVRLASGGLLVYAPVAPTPECVRGVRSLEALHGPVRYIILPTVSAIEHKAFVGPFARQFPQAQVYVSPNQWSFPVNLPLSWLGFPPNRTQVLPANSADAPFADEFDYATVGPIDLNAGPYVETAFFHRLTQTLLMIDSVLTVPTDPPPVLALDPYPLLFHAREDAFDTVEDTAENRRKGWQRIALFTFYFSPSALEVTGLGQTLADALKSPNRSKKAYFGLYPFRWKADWQQSFETLRCEGRLLVAPILQTLIYSRAAKQVLDWADQIASWDFQQIIPCHFTAPVAATPEQLRAAFTFLERPGAGSKTHPLPEADFALLRKIDRQLNGSGVLPPSGGGSG